MPEPLELNEVLQGRKILSVEPGTTAGWMVINLELKTEESQAHPDMRLFLTVFIGGRKGSSDDNYHSTCALHCKTSDTWSTASMVRDERDPEMPMSSAYKALGQASGTGGSDGAVPAERQTEEWNPQ
jgi:hypothetical protein